MPDPEPTFAEQMVAKLETTLLEAAGLQSVTIAGQVVTYAELTKQYEFWKSKVAKEGGSRPVLIEVEMRGS